MENESHHCLQLLFLSFGNDLTVRTNPQEQKGVGGLYSLFIAVCCPLNPSPCFSSFQVMEGAAVPCLYALPLWYSEGTASRHPSLEDASVLPQLRTGLGAFKSQGLFWLRCETKQSPLWEPVMSSSLPFRVINSTLSNLECPASDSASFYCFVYLAFQLQPLQIVLFKMLLPKNLHTSVRGRKKKPTQKTFP